MPVAILPEALSILSYPVVTGFTLIQNRTSEVVGRFCMQIIVVGIWSGFDAVS